MESWKFWLRQLARKLWVRASLYGVFGVGVALAAAAFSPIVPDALAKPFGGGTVESLLNVLATSLLAVATFSVAAMLTAYTNVSQGATPRAAALITGDSHAQGALATFIGAFLYAVVAFSAIGTGYYGKGGRAILFLVTLGVLALVAITLLRWLDQLLTLARVGHAVDQVERATLSAMQGAFGACSPERDPAPAPDDARTVAAGAVGYVQNVDVRALRRLADEKRLDVWVCAPPGTFAHERLVLARVRGPADTHALSAVRAAFTIGDARSFDQDPRFGLTVLGEIAARALSQGINDPGTAIDVVGTAVRVLSRWIEMERSSDCEGHPRVWLPRPAFVDLVDDVFTPVASYGASSLSVALRLQKGLAAIGAVADEERRAVLALASRHALARSEAGLEFEPDRARVREAAVLARDGDDDKGRP